MREGRNFGTAGPIAIPIPIAIAMAMPLGLKELGRRGSDFFGRMRCMDGCQRGDL
ncbi:MAG TPA: hypothetical protein PLI09_28575 [Candidatus Hydrogenedentes bacterium]|nr:hypothetical protein [Candidatus Hydrogenedentota bacterium]